MEADLKTLASNARMMCSGQNSRMCQEPLFHVVLRSSHEKRRLYDLVQLRKHWHDFISSRGDNIVGIAPAITYMLYI